MNRDPILTALAGQVADGTWARAIGAIAATLAEPLTSVVFVLLTPRTAVRAFGAAPAVEGHRSSLVTLMPLAEARTRFAKCAQPQLDHVLALDLDARFFRTVVECDEGWSILVAPVSVLRLDRLAPTAAHHAALARIDNRGRCLADGLSSRGGDA